jgi:hypothetical protein
LPLLGTENVSTRAKPALKHFPAKHARGLDPREDAGSPQEMRSLEEE